MNNLGVLPDNLPAIDTARLPQAYETARTAIAQCERIDECKDWADRMEALASYARQADDEALLKGVQRIKARAIDRCGAILRSIPPDKGGRPASETRGGAPPSFTRTQAATKAGLSPDQRKTAIRVNKVDRELFEQMVESDNPPTIEKLAELGTKKRPEAVTIEQTDDYLRGRDPADFEQGTRLIGLFDWIARRRQELDLDAALRGLNATELQSVTKKLGVTIAWLSRIEEAIDGV